MYNLNYHKEKRPHFVNEFINRYPFAVVTGCDVENKPVATQVPVLIEEREGKKILSGHLMKNTDHHKAFKQNNNVLAMFTGPHAYVSGTWYSNPYTASTWNYMSVHVYGTMSFLDDAGLENLVQRTSLHFEDGNVESTTVFNHLPCDFRRWALLGIVGFEIVAEKTDTVFKLSQDRDFESYRNIIAKLKQQDEASRTVAAEMENRIFALFPEKSGTLIK